MLLLRRFLVLVAFCFWQGGFVFYASVVVPLGTQVFDRHYRPDDKGPSGRRQQGRITRSVARWVNLSGAIALVPMGWDVFSCRDPLRRRKRLRALMCLAAAILLGILLWMYTQLDADFNLDTLALVDEKAFLTRHRAYLWILAAQWGCCVVYLLLCVAAWRAEDVQSTGNTNTPASPN